MMFKKLVEILPQDKIVVGVKWMFRNKLDETCKVLRNNIRHVTKGYSQQKDINYNDTYPLIARLDIICILLSCVLLIVI